MSYCVHIDCAETAPCPKHGKRSITVGYHLIRGLAGPLRMMCYYKQQNFVNKCYGADMKQTWFGADKPALLPKNSCMNLPYIIDGEEVVTQSNTCALYLGRVLGMDQSASATRNHTVLDQVMDLRNDLMKVVYPFGNIKTKDQFPEGAKAHLAGSATGNFTKLEGFCAGPYMCGSTPQSGDFMLFEMLDQHASICAALGQPNILDGFPKLKALHAAMKALPTLAPYFKHAMYAEIAQNNGLLTHFTGQGEGFVYGNTLTENISF